MDQLDLPTPDRLSGGRPSVDQATDVLRLVADARDYAILTLDVRGHVATWNAGAQRFKGYTPSEIIGRHFSVFYTAADIATGRPGHLLEAAARDGRCEDEGWRVRKDGTRFWANVVITALRDEHGVLRGYGKITRDLTERRNAELALYASEERFRLMVENVLEYAILTLDTAGNVATWNAGAQRLKGYAPHDIIGRHFSVFYPSEDIASGKPARVLEAAAAAGRLEDEGWRVRKDGTRFWANVVITALRDADGTLRGFGKITRDLTERRKHESRLEELADRDPLTGALNRRSFGRELNGHVARVARYGPAGMLLLIDLDNFKYYNDTQGHSAGDGLLVRIARRMTERLRESDVFARLGGDEFAVLLPLADDRGAETIAHALLAIVREEGSSALTEARKRVTASIGIAGFADGERLTADEMLANADRAMYGAKEAGRDAAIRFVAAVHGHRSGTPESWAARFERALATGTFEILAQPVRPYRFAGPSQFELLLRLCDQDESGLAPGAFLAFAERLGYGPAIDNYVTVCAIETLAEQRRCGRELRFEINLCGVSIGDEALLRVIETSLAKSQVRPESLIFEVTEAAAVSEMGRTIRFAQRLHALGCGFAIDDFGTGPSFLSYIKHLAFDYLKIDGEFAQYCHQSPTDRIVIAAVADMARSLGKRTIAESVSSPEAFAVLETLGVDYAQGNYVGVPAPLRTYLAAS